MKARLSGMSPGGLFSTGTGFAALAGPVEAFCVPLVGDGVVPPGVGAWVAGVLEVPREVEFVPPHADNPAQVDATRAGARRARNHRVLFMRRACATDDETTMRVQSVLATP